MGFSMPEYWSGCHFLLQASLVAQLVKNLSAMQETWIQSLGWEDPLEKGKATHSSSLARRIQKVRHNWATFTFAFLLQWIFPIQESNPCLLSLDAYIAGRFLTTELLRKPPYICMYLFFFKLFSHLLQHIAQSSCWLCILSSSLLTLITGFSRQKRSLKTHSLPFNIILPRMWVLELLNVLFSLPSRGHQFTEPSNISVASFVPCLPPSGYYHIWQDGVQFHLKWWN